MKCVKGQRRRPMKRKINWPEHHSVEKLPDFYMGSQGLTHDKRDGVAHKAAAKSIVPPHPFISTNVLHFLALLRLGLMLDIFLYIACIYALCSLCGACICKEQSIYCCFLGTFPFPDINRKSSMAQLRQYNDTLDCLGCNSLCPRPQRF